MESTVKRWRCDVCGEWVTPEEGYVLWGHKDHMNVGFQIIHQKRCDRNDKPASCSLKDFMGPDGLTRALALMSVGPIILNNHPDSEFAQKVNTDEFADFLRRLFVPNYEEARPNFDKHEVLDDWHDAGETRPYMQDALIRIAKKKL
jgi:hypothetical protein